MNAPTNSPVANDSDKREPTNRPPKNAPAAKTRHAAICPQSQNNEPSSWDTPAPDESYPYWVPPGVELDAWPLALRADVASIINPTYRELVLLAKPGLVQSTGITVVHLLWLEILDQIQLGRQLPAPGVDPTLDPFGTLGIESRRQQIERHLRLVHAKLKASELLLRLDELKARWQSQNEFDDPYPHVNAFPRRRQPQNVF